MNFTRALGGNFSYIPHDCYVFMEDYWHVTKTKFNSFDNNVGDFMLAFLFNLMGNALAFKKAFNDIDDDLAN